ncbi:MAG: hypothetical protein AAB869_02215 [Patescibacteria group bacterium]
MILRSVRIAVVFGLMFFAAVSSADGVDRSKLNERETVEQLGKDLAGLHDVVLTANFAPKIADHVVANGKKVRFNPGSKDEGTSYELRFYTEHDIYVLSVLEFDNGDPRIFNMSFYRTNQRFSEFSTLADQVADQLIWGMPKIIWEEHFSDTNADGSLEMLQTFVKEKDGAYPGFTREERNLGAKAGVTQELFSDGEVIEDGVRRKAIDEEVAEIRKEYAYHLRVIAQKFGIQ